MNEDECHATDVSLIHEILSFLFQTFSYYILSEEREEWHFLLKGVEDLRIEGVVGHPMRIQIVLFF